MPSSPGERGRQLRPIGPENEGKNKLCGSPGQAGRRGVEMAGSPKQGMQAALCWGGEGLCFLEQEAGTTLSGATRGRAGTLLGWTLEETESSPHVSPFWQHVQLSS